LNKGFGTCTARQRRTACSVTRSSKPWETNDSAARQPWEHPVIEGVSAGTGLMLAFISEISGEEVAGKVQFAAEYDPSGKR